ncbi:hypothetical protein SDC9_61650 [bioreactor metagenome]|uniref:Uncharacterized protein n=1 Tax=bioreactor metagenome TaxID=1076179 RepID=A0A644XGD0_9ZZZZ
MEIFAHYFRILSLAVIIMLPVAATMFLTYRAKKRRNTASPRDCGRLVFFRKLMIISAVAVPVFIFVNVVFLSDVPFLIYGSDDQFASERLKPFMNHKLPNDSTEALFQTQSVQYLKARHHDRIYYSDFVFDAKDSIEISLILYYIRHPELNDSSKADLRSNVKTTDDIGKYLTD